MILKEVLNQMKTVFHLVFCYSGILILPKLEHFTNAWKFKESNKEQKLHFKAQMQTRKINNINRKTNSSKNIYYKTWKILSTSQAVSFDQLTDQMRTSTAYKIADPLHHYY